MRLHVPVMLREVLELLMPQRGGLYVDATVGAGGHAEALLRELPSGSVLLCTDRDEEALRMAARRLKAPGGVRLLIRKARFSQLAELLEPLGAAQGMLFDLGASMMQLTDPHRGFGLSSPAPLDMRMEASQALTAHEIVNTWPQRRLEELFRLYGQEPRARKAAQMIVRSRPIGSCRQLAAPLQGLYGPGRRRLHPATRLFQALRIVVNDELGQLRAALRSLPELLAPGGRAVFISYHSLEDREVKHYLRARRDVLKVLTPKPLRPSEEEVARNPSARSARLRAAERLVA